MSNKLPCDCRMSFPRHTYESLTYKKERFLVREEGSGTREAPKRSLMEHNMVIKSP